MNPRQAAFTLLTKAYFDKSYSNILLHSFFKKNEFSQRDKAFVSSLFYGVTERMMTLDYQLSLSLKQPLKKLRPEVLIILRMGVYQLLFMDKVPSGAAVNESIELAKRNKCAYAAGLINAVLRSVDAKGILLPDKNKFSEYLSIKYSAEVWIADLLRRVYSDNGAEKILASSLWAQETVLRVNTVQTNLKDYLSVLHNNGVHYRVNPLCEKSVILSKAGAVEALPGFKSGYFHVQDTASQLCADSLGAQPGERVLDACSAPGGKAFTIAENMNNSGEVIACDLYEHKINLINNGAQRLGLHIIKAFKNDASVFNPNLGAFDRVLCDVPCSGLGIIRRKPEIKYKKRSEFQGLSDIQYKILETSYRYLKKGGILVYSTCTLIPEENEILLRRFAKNSGAEYISEKTYLPHIDGTDGFFIGIIKKNG